MKSTAFKILLIITLAGAFLRFFHLAQTLQFLGDQGRDALIVRRLLIEHDPVFIGPVTSVGNMYLGPAYYYFMVPFLALTYPSPMGPVYAVALIGTLTIPLIYIVGKEILGKKPALLAAIMYAFGWTFIVQSRFSWNPNPAPFVSLCMIWATYRAWKQNSVYWILVSFCFSLLIQLHYLTLLSLPAAGIFWLLSLRELWLRKKPLKNFFIHTIVAICLFVISLTPLILFDLKHEFLNANAFYNIIFGKEDQVRDQQEFIRILEETLGKSRFILYEITTTKIGWLNSLLVFLTFGLLGWTIRKEKGSSNAGIILVTSWLIIGILGTSVYKSTVFPHYIAYLFPVVCLIFGVILANCWRHKQLKFLVPVFFLWYLGTNFYYYDYKPAGWTVRDMEEYSKLLLTHVESGEPYNIVGINSYQDTNAMNYRYYLTAWGSKPLDREDANSAKKLLIINETDQTVQEILDLPTYEIVIFPDKQNNQVFHYPNAPELIILRR